jgi:hypothetical protein
MSGSAWDRITIRGTQIVGTMLRKLRAPGFIKDVEIQDETSGHSISVKSTALFTIVTVNGRDFFFHRLSGRFDGTGSGCS